MKTMRFLEQQKAVQAYEIGDGKRDIVICLNERVDFEKPENSDTPQKVYEYDGNVFRTCKLTADDVEESPETYINYTGDEPPTEEMTEYANEVVDKYTMQLMADGII